MVRKLSNTHCYHGYQVGFDKFKEGFVSVLSKAVDDLDVELSEGEEEEGDMEYDEEEEEEDAEEEDAEEEDAEEEDAEGAKPGESSSMKPSNN